MPFIKTFVFITFFCVASLSQAQTEQQAKTDPQHPHETIHIAVASNFTFAMNELITQFEANTGHSVKASYGSSGKIYAQIQHGAPFQIFFSADQAKPKALENAGMVVADSRFTYAVGALVLWSTKPDLIVNGESVLSGDDFNKLALANPKLAPYGAAAVQVLEQLNRVKSTRSKWIQGENIAQTYQFVATGNADLGFVALSQLKQAQLKQASPKPDSSWVVPQTLYSPIKQDAVLLKRGKDSAAAKALISFIQSNQGRTIIESYGYTSTSNAVANQSKHLDQQIHVDQ